MDDKRYAVLVSYQHQQVLASSWGWELRYTHDWKDCTKGEAEKRAAQFERNPQNGWGQVKPAIVVEYGSTEERAYLNQRTNYYHS